MRQRLCKVCRGWHSFDAWPAECIPERESKRSHLGVPYIRSDGMSPTMNHADGRVYDSRSYYAAVKAAGCEIIGNEKLPEVKRAEPDITDLKRDVKTAVEQVEARL